MTILYLLLLVASAALSALMTYCVGKASVNLGFISAPVSERHVHTNPIPRLGGIAICLSFMITVVAVKAVLGPSSLVNFPSWGHIWLLGPALIVFLTGVYDDFRSLSPIAKLVFQTLAALVTYFGGFGLHYSGAFLGSFFVGKLMGLLITVVWILLLTNGFNLVDGLDGLAAGTALFSTMALFALFLSSGDKGMIILLVAFAGAILGFLPYNFYPSSIFMGDGGSMFIGFMLGVVSLQVVRNSAPPFIVAITALSFALPILDVGLAVLRRLLGGQSLFSPDARHIHHRILSRGFSQRNAVLVLYAVMTGFVLASMALIYFPKAAVPIVAVVCVSACFGVRELRYSEFSILPKIRQLSASRRRGAPDRDGIRLASRSLSACSEFFAICDVLKEALQPIGINGIRLTNWAGEQISAERLNPLRYAASGELNYLWGGSDSRDQVWGHRLKIASGCSHSCEYIFFLGNGASEKRWSNLLSEEFRMALSGALDRATIQAKSLTEPTYLAPNSQVRSMQQAD